VRGLPLLLFYRSKIIIPFVIVFTGSCSGIYFDTRYHAGIATEKNLATLTQKWHKYMVVSRSKFKDYQPVQQAKETYLLIKSKKITRLSLMQSEKYTDSFLKV
jgi:hypothetical protein